ncbi:MAG: hypothetical protein HXX20_13725 [Chloroflexi bacterium]|nr:hypothetical protein [Chloroflexota bacterium]
MPKDLHNNSLPQLTDGSGNHEPLPEVTGAVVSRPDFLRQYLVPALLILAVLVGVFILAYSIGLDRGKRAANEERDSFYQERIARLTGGNDTTTNATPGAKPAGNGIQTFARVDKINGDRLTVVLLGPSDTPTGVSLVIVADKGMQVYKSAEGQVVEIHPGDNILITGDKTGDNYIARNILILPAAG